MTRLRIGVQYTPAPDQTVAELISAATEIEAMGYHCFSLPDHLTRPHGGQRVAVPDPVAVLARLAADTHTIDLGTMTLLDALRQPVQTLRSAATLQRISGGRLEWGIGAGWQQADLDTLPATIAEVDARIAALRQTLTLLRQAWPATPSTNQPNPTDLPTNGSAGDVAGVLAAGIAAPRLIVAAGSHRMLRLAASFADTIALTVPTRPRLAGTRPTAASVTAQIAAARATRPTGMPVVDFHLQIRTITATAPTDPDSDWWALGGGPSQMADALMRRAATGVGYLSLCLQDLRQLEHLAAHVLSLCDEVRS
jgi:alkanesulfonate monooxygenase SsuD/methylene tetrahydromethanopterin reductase-like flavin-dependent oxidoreductase (luciferase family)